MNINQISFFQFYIFFQIIQLYKKNNFRILMQNIISAFINGALSAYMVEVKSKSITGSLTHKNLIISELEIFPDALLQHGLPILIKKGLIKNVDIHIPTKITTEPVKITIESVTIFANIYTRHPSPNEIINMKIRLLKSYKYFRKRYKPILGLLQRASFLSFFRTIMSNVIMEIKHIHIRIEYSPKINLDSINPDTFSKPINDKKHTNIVLPDDDIDDDNNVSKKSKTKSINIFKKLYNDDDYYYSDDESNDSSYDEDISSSTRFAMYEQFNQENDQSNDKVTAIGIIMKKLVIQNPENYEVISNEKIVKNINFSDLAVYMDVDQISVNLSSKESFISHMDNFYDSNDHNWILKPFSFSSLIKYEKDNPALLIEIIMKKILINIKEEYIPLLIELLKMIQLLIFPNLYQNAHKVFGFTSTNVH